MAADAFKSLGKKMDAAKEAEIAAYIMRDIELRQENAKGMLQSPVSVMRSLDCK